MLTFYSGGEEKPEKKKEENIRRRRISFFWRRIKTEKEREENIWRRSLQKLSRILRSLGSVSVSRLLPIFGGFRYWFRKKNLGFGYGKFGLGKKVSVSVSEILVSEKKYRIRSRKIWYRKKSLGFGFGTFGIGKKSRYRFRSKFWYRHSVVPMMPKRIGQYK